MPGSHEFRQSLVCRDVDLKYMSMCHDLNIHRKEALGECDKETTFAILDHFYESGGNFIDTYARPMPYKYH